MEDVRVVLEEAPDPRDVERLEHEIGEYNVAATGRADWFPLAVFLRDAAGRTCGGLAGEVWAGWLHVRFLWVAEALRRRGFGSRLLREAEAYAVRRGCEAVHLESFSFQAPDFYRKHGYEVFGELAGYPRGHRQVYLWKRLARGPR